MHNKLLISFILITLAVTAGSEDIVTAEDHPGVFIIAPNTLDMACNKIDIYSSYQSCKCDVSCLGDSKCCPDDQSCGERQYKDEEMDCVNTLQGDISMVKTCLPNASKKFKIKCQTNNASKLVNDFLLTTPVTTQQGITYRNLFCALCNNVPAYVIWNVALRCELNERLSNINLTSLLNELKVDPDHPQLISKVNDTPVRCSTHGYLPSAWIKSVRFCGPSKGTANCSICQAAPSDQCVNNDVSNGKLLSVPLINSYIPKKVDEDIYGFIFENRDAFATRVKKIGEISDIDLCFPKKKSQHCLFISTVNRRFNFTSNETIFVDYEPYRGSFGTTHWSRTLNKSSVHFCTDAPERLESTMRVISRFITDVLDIFSAICLIAFFVIGYSRKEKLQNLTYKIICSFAVTLFAVYIIDRIPYAILPIPCTAFTSATGHYLYLCLYAWILVAAYDFWRVIYLSPDQYRIVGSNEDHTVRHIVYSLTGWFAPLSIIFIGLYFDAAPIDTIPCDLRPAYGRTGSCFIEQAKPRMYLYSLPCTIVFSIAAVLFVVTSYRVRTIKRENQNSVSQNEFFSNFVKLSSIMSLFALDILWMYTDNEILHSLNIFALGMLGILVFFAFVFEKRMVRKVINKIQK